jgi:hypothetical protein
MLLASAPREYARSTIKSVQKARGIFLWCGISQALPGNHGNTKTSFIVKEARRPSLIGVRDGPLDAARLTKFAS